MMRGGRGVSAFSDDAAIPVTRPKNQQLGYFHLTESQDLACITLYAEDMVSENLQLLNENGNIIL